MNYIVSKLRLKYTEDSLNYNPLSTKVQIFISMVKRVRIVAKVSLSGIYESYFLETTT
jgi:hypothetical protein